MSNITICIPTSPIPSHPSTSIIEETLTSVRHHLPDAPIVLMLDAIREEQVDKYLEKYTKYLDRLISVVLTPHRLKVRLVPFMHQTHQAGMLRKTLEIVTTPTILWLEHDTPLVTDYEIPFPTIIRAVRSEEVNLIRFLHEAEIHPEHQHLMCGLLTVGGLPLTKTIQFSARPHVASKAFYERLLARFSPDANCFIEDFAHSVCQCEPWENWKLSIFTPEGNKKRSYHTDGRAGEEKFSEKQVF